MKEGITDCTIIGTGIGGGDGDKATYVALDCEAPDGEVVCVKLYTSPNAWPYTRSKLAQLGLELDEACPKFELLNDDNALIGKSCKVKKKIEEHGGEPRERYDVWFPFRAQRHSPEKAQALAEAMRQQVAPQQVNGFDWSTGQ